MPVLKLLLSIFVEVLKSNYQVVFLQYLIALVVENMLNHLLPSQSVDSKVQIPHQNYLVVVFHRHTSVFEVTLEGIFEYFGNHLISLPLPPPAADEVAVDGHE